MSHRVVACRGAQAGTNASYTMLWKATATHISLVLVRQCYPPQCSPLFSTVSQRTSSVNTGNMHLCIQYGIVYDISSICICCSRRRRFANATPLRKIADDQMTEHTTLLFKVSCIKSV